MISFDIFLVEPLYKYILFTNENISFVVLRDVLYALVYFFDLSTCVIRNKLTIFAKNILDTQNNNLK